MIYLPGMTQIIVLLVSALVLQTSAGKAGPWQSLFDGKSPNGWVEVTGKPFPTTSWTIQDG